MRRGVALPVVLLSGLRGVMTPRGVPTGLSRGSAVWLYRCTNFSRSIRTRVRCASLRVSPRACTGPIELCFHCGNHRFNDRGVLAHSVVLEGALPVRVPKEGTATMAVLEDDGGAKEDFAAVDFGFGVSAAGAAARSFEARRLDDFFAVLKPTLRGVAEAGAEAGAPAVLFSVGIATRRPRERMPKRVWKQKFWPAS